MKNLKIIATMVCILCALTLSAKIVVEKKNGGKNGYRDITETHSGNNHKLICCNPGHEQCTWNQGVPQANQQQLSAIDAFIENQLSEGNYTGTGNLSGTNLWFFWLYDVNTGILRYTVNEDEPDYNF
jgi:hypothetical protein